MALKLGLLCFQFSRIDDLLHDPGLEFDFSRKAPPIAGEAIQPIIGEAVARIKRAIAKSVSSWFTFGRTSTLNVSNFLHIASISFNTQIEHTDGSTGQTSFVNVIKFYHLEDCDSYRVTLDVEGMHSSAVDTFEEGAFEAGITGEQIEHLAGLLEEEFELEGRIEYLALIERGRLNRNKLPEEQELADSGAQERQQNWQALEDKQVP